jgi:predicted nucleotidyltransferase
MRLLHEERTFISNAIHHFDAAATVYLFGSRTGDTAKGGDIDLLVLSTKINLMAKLEILAQLHQALGDRKIDIAIYPDTTRPFPRMVMQEAVRL